MGPRFRRMLLCAFVLLAVAGNFNVFGEVEAWSISPEEVRNTTGSEQPVTEDSTATSPTARSEQPVTKDSTATSPTARSEQPVTAHSMATSPTARSEQPVTEDSTATSPTAGSEQPVTAHSTATSPTARSEQPLTEDSPSTSPTARSEQPVTAHSTTTSPTARSEQPVTEDSPATSPTARSEQPVTEDSTATSPTVPSTTGSEQPVTEDSPATSPTARSEQPVTEDSTATSPTVRSEQPVTAHSTATSPTARSEQPVTEDSPATSPTARSEQPVTEDSTATSPTARSEQPVTAHSTASSPTARSEQPVTAHSTASSPTARSEQPVTEDSTATSPTARSEQPVTEDSTATSPTAPKCPDINVRVCESVPYRHCEMRNGEPECYCEKGLRKKGDKCEIVKKLTVKFQIKNFRRRRDASPIECIKNITKLIDMIKEAVPNVDESTIVCNGTDVSFDVFVENAADVDEVKKFEECKGPDCKLGTLSISAPKVEITRQCKELRAVAEGFGMECEDSANGTQFACNNNKTRVVGSTELNGVPFDICKPLPCNETCKDERRHCLLESCVCKPQYKYDSKTGKCESICEAVPNLCHSEATCEIGKNYQNFYCRCPAKRTGPLCQYENKSFQSAQLNIVIVGVVLSSLLLMCFVVSASIISRLKKKLEGPNFKKDPERNGQRELRGYDGPYRASDPASLRRERDYTSL